MSGGSPAGAGAGGGSGARDAELLVVGDGLAGLTAALFGARHGLRTVLVGGGLPGGPLLSVTRIDDFPGFADGVAGYDLGPIVQEQAVAAGADVRAGEVVALEQDAGGGWAARTADGGVLRSGAVVLATGSAPRPLGVPGEERLQGRGLSHCASCDGPLHRGAVVGVVGAGDAGLQEALELAGHAREVVVIEREPQPTAQAAYRRRVESVAAIRVLAGHVVEEILGDTAVEGVRVRSLASGSITSIGLSGLFAYVGTAPRTGLVAPLLPLAGDGRVPTDARLRTALPGLLAAGDVRVGSAAQAVAVAGDGATAAVEAHRYLAGAPWR